MEDVVFKKKVIELLERNNLMLEMLGIKVDEWMNDDIRQHDERKDLLKNNYTKAIVA